MSPWLHLQLSISDCELPVAGHFVLTSFVSARLQLDSRVRNSKYKAPGTKFPTHTAALPADRLSSRAAPVCSKRAALRRVTRKKRQRKLVDQLASLRKASPRARA